MILRRFWSYVLGYLILSVKGEHPERFINLALTRGISLWDLVWVDSGHLFVRVYARSFHSLRHISHRTNCRIRIKSKRGLPFILNRLKRRRMLVAGAVVFCLLLYFFSSLIWVVDVEGNRTISSDKVRRIAAASGLRPGAFCFQVRRADVVDELLRAFPNLDYVEVDVGTRSRIRIVEKSLPKKETGPCDIVAGKDGLIKELLVLAGVPCVKEGEVVRRGQILISGTAYAPAPPEASDSAVPPASKPEPQFLEAKGIVRARVWYRSYGEAPLDEVVKKKTGRTVDIFYVEVDNKKIILRGPRTIPYSLYDIKVKRIKFPQWRNIKLPVEFVTIEAEEIKCLRIVRSHEEAIKIAVQEAQENAAQMLPKKVPVVKRRLRVINAGDDNLVRVLLTVETVEDIGHVKKIQPSKQIKTGALINSP